MNIRSYRRFIIISVAILAFTGCSSKKDSGEDAVAAVMSELETTESSAEICSSYTVADKKISILFNGLPDKDLLPQLMQTLSDGGISALFFTDSSDTEKRSEDIAEIVNSGFDIGIMLKSIDVKKAVEEIYNVKQSFSSLNYEPKYIMSDDGEYSEELLKAAALSGIDGAISPVCTIKADGLSSKEDAVMLLHRTTKGSVISFDIANENKDSAADSLINTVGFMAEALSEKGFSAVSVADLKDSQSSTEVIKIDENDKRFDINSYEKYVTDKPFGIQESEAKTEDYFNNTVFVGDSISVKLRMYAEYMRKINGSFMGNAQFLTTQGLSAGNALWELTDESKHPYYNGEHMLIQDAIAKMDVDKVYIMLGINDIPSYSLDRYLENYQTLISLIKEQSPNVEIYIQSITPCIASRTKIPTNKEIFTFDLALAKFCEENSYNFVDVAYAMRDENGNLPDSYCYDADTMGLHFTNDACQKWIDFLLTHTKQEE